MTTQPVNSRERARPSCAAILRHPVVLSLMIIAVPVMWRVLLVFESTRTSRFDLRGFEVDLGVAATCAALILAALNLKRVLAVLVVVMWCVVCAGSYEHVRALDTWPSVSQASYLASRTFVLGSALQHSRPVILAVSTILIVVMSLMVRRPAKRWLWPAVAASGGIAMMMLASMTPVRGHEVLWRQTNPIEHNIVRWLTHDPGPTSQQQRHLEMELQVDQLLEPDLDGQPIVQLRREQHTNVLLILLESVSGAYLPTISAHHGVSSQVGLPFLDELCQAGLCYPNFVNQQRQTNRGEYAILAGDYPRLLPGTPKMSDFRTRSGQQYLPHALQRHGYRTIYMQSAPMAFMIKDQFMPAAGFQSCYGDETFKRGYYRNNWGVDDLAFFEQAARLLQELDREPSPWFVTMLTVGTHHPHLVPEDFDWQRGEDETERAFRYTDAALQVFFELLRPSGILDDTVVLLTSDESSPMKGAANGQLQQLSSNWGFLIVLTPDREVQWVRTPFAHNDVALSIVDYLGLHQEARHFSGRSVFRRYSSGRPILFGNVYRNHVGEFGVDHVVRVFTDSFEGKWQARFRPEAIFHVTPLDAPPQEAGALYHLAHRVSETAATQSGQRDMALVDPARRAIPVSEEYIPVFGGQYFAADEDMLFTMNIRVKVEAPPNARVQFRHDLLVEYNRLETTESTVIQAGQTYEYSLTYRTGGPEKAIELSQMIRNLGNAAARVRLLEANLNTVPIRELSAIRWKAGQPYIRYRIMEGDRVLVIGR